ncbi:type 4a pilus biogenesis protein PilO [Geobacter sp. DSM 9736]|uniref:type 4a pilus biogenesis protein PilO n=1 Tax=Geobacter sp. DSM 9736 TaxID=1277350 RepID=UPI000B502FDD|nr:type 4a pilus biogenesis protein PilO [Geobacter sp. DSM 9736]SNB46190.1 type IV pilus assembly protein PilO [Geobacter sp. DSM 9736]
MDPRLDKILKLPNRQKLGLLVAVLILEAGVFFLALQQPKMKELKELQGRRDELQSKVEENRRIANNLPKFRDDYAKLEKELERALTELPNQKEIPGLLTSISSVGKNAGLDFLLFRPKPEEPKDFYSAVPVDISVSGSFYEVANFFVAVGDLPRIVNISNVQFGDIKNERGRTTVKVNCLATTFRFLDKKEIKDEKK